MLQGPSWISVQPFDTIPKSLPTPSPFKRIKNENFELRQNLTIESDKTEFPLFDTECPYVPIAPLPDRSYKFDHVALPLELTNLPDNRKENFIEPKDRQFPVGLINLGNTCFMNAALQCLIHSSLLTGYFLSQKYATDPFKDTENVVEVYAALLNDILHSPCDAISPHSLKMSITALAPQFSGFLQQDSHEWLTIFLNALHERMNRFSHSQKVLNLMNEAPENLNTLSDKASRVNSGCGLDEDKDTEIYWSRYKRENDSVVADMFHGLLLNTIQCPSCGYKSNTYEPFLTLSLPIPSIKVILRRAQFPVVLVSGQFSCVHLDESSWHPWNYIGDLRKQISEKFTAENNSKWLMVSLAHDGRPNVLSDYMCSSLVDFKDIIVYECQNSTFSIWLNFGVLIDRKNVSRIGVPRLLSLSLVPKSLSALQDLISISLNLKDFPFYLESNDENNLYPDYESQFSASTTSYSFPSTRVIFQFDMPTQLAAYPDVTHIIPMEPQQLTLYDCLVDFLKEEVLGEGNSWTCTGCLKPQSALKKISLCKLPESYLIFHLKQYDSALQAVHPNLTLDLSSLLVSTDNSGNSKWDLYAAIKHSGSLSFGHYTAKVLCRKNSFKGDCRIEDKEQAWFLMNDSFVSEAAGPPSEGHVLFYKKATI